MNVSFYKDRYNAMKSRRELYSCQYKLPENSCMVAKETYDTLPFQQVFRDLSDSIGSGTVECGFAI